MNFQHPLLLWLLLPAAVLALLHHRRSISAARRRRFPILFLAAASLTVALANPYWSYTTEKEVLRGVDFVVILDVSQSMFCRETEGGLRRIEYAQQLLRTLTPRMTGSSAGVIYFAGDAQVGCPLTPDLSAPALFFDSVTPGMTPLMGSRAQTLPDALEEMLDVRGPSRKTVGLMFSDGEFDDSVRPLARWLQDRGDFTLYTVLCGKERAAVPELDLDLPHPQAFSRPDPSTLETIATAGGGVAYDLSSASPAQIEAALLSHVQETVSAGRPVPDYQPAPFAALALVLLLLYQFLPARDPARKLLAAEAIAASLVILLFATGAVPPEDDRAALFRSALEDARKGNLDQAAAKLGQIKQMGASEEVEVALGNILLEQKKYDESIARYSEAMDRNPYNETARWNWEVALKRKSREAPPPEPPPPTPPQQLPQETSALLKYFDQLEKEQIRRNNLQHENTSEFAW